MKEKRETRGKEKENILRMTSAMTSVARHELRCMGDVRDGRDTCEDVKRRDFVGRARDFLTERNMHTTRYMHHETREGKDT